MKFFLTAVFGLLLAFAPVYAEDTNKGEKGDKGDKGAKGDKGDKGDRGVSGDKGAKGDKGDKGDRGSKGDPGERGVKGDRGDRGPVGPVGPVGATGAVGPAGPVGAEGEPGLPGLRGADGKPGKDGATGPQGKPGSLRDFTSTPDFKDCTVIGEPFDVSTDTDGSVRFTFLGSKTTALHGYRCPLKPTGTVEIAITPDHALSASGLLFGVLGVNGSPTGFVENFVAGKHTGGFLTLMPNGVASGTVSEFYPETGTLWFRIVGEPGMVKFFYSATGKYWSQVAWSDVLAGVPYFVVLGEDLAGDKPYSFAVRHMRRP